MIWHSFLLEISVEKRVSQQKNWREKRAFLGLALGLGARTRCGPVVGVLGIGVSHCFLAFDRVRDDTGPSQAEVEGPTAAGGVARVERPGVARSAVTSDPEIAN